MPEQATLQRAARKRREGKAPTTQAGEFVREEIEHVREGKHVARSPQQAIAIALAKARRAGVKLPPPPAGSRSAASAASARRHAGKHAAPQRSRRTSSLLQSETHTTATPSAHASLTLRNDAR